MHRSIVATPLLALEDYLARMKAHAVGMLCRTYHVAPAVN